MGGNPSKEKKQVDTEAALQQKANDLEAMLRTVKKQPNLQVILEIFNKLSESPNFNALSETMISLTNVMKEMSGVLHNLEGRTEIEKQRIDQIYVIIDQFKELLDATGKTFKNVKTQAHIQAINMTNLIQSIRNCKTSHINRDISNNTFNESKQESHDSYSMQFESEVKDQECKESEGQTNIDTFNQSEFEQQLYCLSQWMSDDAVKDNLQLWAQFYQICKSEHREWSQLVNNASEKLRSCQNWKKFLKCVKYLGAGMGLIGAIVILLACPFAGTLVTCSIGAYAAGAGGLVIGGIAWKLGNDTNDEKMLRIKEIREKTQQIRSSLQVILYFNERIKKDVKNVNDLKMQTISEFVKQIRDPKINAKNIILTNAQSIKTYLIQYQNDCDQIVKQVNEAEGVFVDVWKNMAL